MELRLVFLLSLILLWDSVCVCGFKSTSAISKRNSEEHLMSPANLLQVRDEHSVHIHPGETLTIHCTDGGNQVLSQFWQTPFGLFDGCDHRNRDPVETCNGTLRISRVTFSHDGLYYCIRLEETSKTMTPYRVRVEFNSNVKNQQREADVYSETVSESHFTAAVASSVIVSFFVAFTLGTFSRSYVIKCLQSIRVRIPKRKRDDTDGQASRVQSETVFFSHTGEDTVDVGLAVQNREIDDNVNVVVDDGGNNESESTPSRSCEGEEQTQEFKPVVSPHPRKKSRVIRVYDYDEEGNRYSHIKEPEVEVEVKEVVKPKLRSRSLMRLDAIMKQAETLDISLDKESTRGDEDSDTPGDAADSQTH